MILDALVESRALAHTRGLDHSAFIGTSGHNGRPTGEVVSWFELCSLTWRVPFVALKNLHGVRASTRAATFPWVVPV